MQQQTDEQTTSTDSSHRRKRPPIEGLLRLGSLSAAAVAGGIYLITRWHTLGSGSRVGAILLIAFGGILALPVGLVLLAFLLRAYFLRKLQKSVGDIIEPSRKLVEKNKLLFSEVQEMRPATEDDFASLDRQWYDSATAEAQALDFRHVGDIVNATIERAVGMTVVLRVLVSPDGTTTCALYHVPIAKLPARLQGQKLYTIDFESEFSDGSFVLTSNTLESDQTTSPPQIHRARLSISTPIPELAAAHEKEKASVLTAKPGVSCVRISTLTDVLESQRRQQLIKAAFRKGIGYLDPEEVRRIASLNPNRDEASIALATATAEIARQEEQQRGDQSQSAYR